MKTSKAKSNSYSDILIQDESGLAIIRVSKKLIKAFTTLHQLQLSDLRLSVNAIA